MDQTFIPDFLTLAIAPTATGIAIAIANPMITTTPPTSSKQQDTKTNADTQKSLPVRPNILAKAFFPLPPNQLSTQFIPLIQHILNDLGFDQTTSIRRLNTIITTSGPGSFTSLRIAMAGSQGLAMATKAHLFTPTRLDLYRYLATQTKKSYLLVVNQSRPLLLGYIIRPNQEESAISFLSKANNPYLYNQSSSPTTMIPLADITLLDPAPLDVFMAMANEMGVLLMGDNDKHNNEEKTSTAEVVALVDYLWSIQTATSLLAQNQREAAKESVYEPSYKVYYGGKAYYE